MVAGGVVSLHAFLITFPTIVTLRVNDVERVSFGPWAFGLFC
ncbi:hypothetical protein GLYMA_17G118250v4 [Glycine max]|nr:hypothetical protein GLYMA_17G118250v4 [Glycine max]KAH1118038.1 hypothetical protein GYH30_047012 [Glycine max]